MVLFREISDLVMDSLGATVFGLQNKDRKMKIYINGTLSEVTLGESLRNIL